MTGGTGKINVTGWTFDYDDAGASLAVHVYIGGPAGQEGCDSAQIYADKVRSDVNTVLELAIITALTMTFIPINQAGRMCMYMQ